MDIDAILLAAKGPKGDNGDPTLSADLASTDPGKGAELVSRGSVTVASFADIADVPAEAGQRGMSINLTSYHPNLNKGGGRFFWDDTSTDADDGGTVVTPSGHSDPGRWVRQLDGYVTPEMFGAKGDGVADDTLALGSVSSAGLACIAWGDYLITDTINLVDIEFHNHGLILFGGSDDRPAINIYSSDPSTILRHKRYTLNVRRVIRSLWTDYNSVGIRLTNLQYCQIVVDNVEGFTVGIQALGNDGGFAYNEMWMGLVRNNHVGLLLSSAGAAGYVNENAWHGGNFNCDSNVYPDKDRYGIIIRSLDGQYRVNNNNVFLKPCLQVRRPASAVGTGVCVEDGLNNSFLGCRFEEDTVGAHFRFNSTQNRVDVGYMSGVTTPYIDDSIYPTNVINDPHNPQMASLVPVTQIATLGSVASGISGTDVIVPGMTWLSSDSGSVLRDSSLTNVTFDSSSVSIPSTRAMGRVIDTSTVKRLIAYRTNKSTSAGQGRWLVKCYDAGMTLLTGGDDVNSTVRDTSITTYTTAYGGGYRSGNNSSQPLSIIVSDDTKYVWIGVTGGTDGDVSVTSYSVFCSPQDSPPMAFSGGNYEKTLPRTPMTSGGALWRNILGDDLLQISPTDPTAGESVVFVRYYGSSGVAFQRVTVGDADSGGSGFRVLRVPN